MGLYRKQQPNETDTDYATYREARRLEYNARVKAYKESHKSEIQTYRDTVVAPYRSVVNCPDGFVVHHLNHDHNDNRRQNLLVMTREDHMSYHQFMRYGNYGKAAEIIYKYEVF